jgi:hypothetical protein
VRMSQVWEATVRMKYGLHGMLSGREPPGASAPALFFHHVAKTGGTSLIRTMRAMVGPSLQASENGDLSVTFVERLVASGLKPGQFIYGHPGAGAARPLVGRAAMAVMLREPREQAISNYLWVLSDPRLPDHAVASARDFRGFLLERPYFAIFQTASLYVGLERRPLERLQTLIERLPSLLDYLGEFQLVGTTEAAAEFYRRACASLGLRDPPSLPHHRRSRVAKGRRQQMRDQYDELACDPLLGPLIGAERALHQAALRLSSPAPAAHPAKEPASLEHTGAEI